MHKIFTRLVCVNGKHTESFFCSSVRVKRTREENTIIFFNFPLGGASYKPDFCNIFSRLFTICTCNASCSI